MDLKNIWGSEGKEPLQLQDIGLPKILVIVAVGIVLLVLSLPGTGGSQKKIGKQENSSDVTSEEASEQIALDAMEQYNKKIEKELCELLRKVDGVGDVQVMITLASSEERVTLQNDSATTESTGEDGTGSKRQKESATTESVLVRKDGQDTPYLVQI
jgi:stage III sporulation protein AG